MSYRLAVQPNLGFHPEVELMETVLLQVQEPGNLHLLGFHPEVELMETHWGVQLSPHRKYKHLASTRKSN